MKGKKWTYEGKHCNEACALLRQNKMCQCKFDRKYERECMENPGGTKTKKRKNGKKNKNTSPTI